MKNKPLQLIKPLSARFGHPFDAPIEAMLCRFSPRYKMRYLAMISQRDNLRLGCYYHNFKLFLHSAVKADDEDVRQYLFQEAEKWALKMQEKAPDLPTGWIAMARLHVAANNKEEAMESSQTMLEKLAAIPQSIRRGLNATGLAVRRQAEQMKKTSPWEKYWRQLERIGAAW